MLFRSPAAKLVGVSHARIDAAEKVIDLGIPALAAMVHEDKVAVSSAAEVAKLPPDRQEEIVQQGARAVTRAASDQRKERKAAKLAESAPPPPSGDGPPVLDAMRQIVEQSTLLTYLALANRAEKNAFIDWIKDYVLQSR